ncbi:hypothetical protein [Cellulomonas sp. Leaf334]|uniref:hypothetical protein n=1 Tax=Cellulomonas sp. Leaf334 TaxID=1736339 RepID=UPI0006F8F4B4|nr:hypothetical protein [Cellulomonas sp. Leaf334]KQR16763.1 hypothetical protein ASF78_05270 [Cellulomonas sp. Leaf334]
MNLPPDEHPPGLVLDARLHLLDRQVLDVDGVPVCTVDDLEVHGVDGSDLPDGSRPAVVTSLLSGAVLATRVFGGRPPSSRWHRIRWTHVADVGTTVALGVRGDTLDVTWTERWVRDRVIGRLPGGRHDPG